MSQRIWRPRLSIELTEEQYERLQQNLPWGVKQTLFSKIIDEVNVLVETHGPAVIGAMFRGDLIITVKEGSDATKRP